MQDIQVVIKNRQIGRSSSYISSAHRSCCSEVTACADLRYLCIWPCKSMTFRILLFVITQNYVSSYNIPSCFPKSKTTWFISQFPKSICLSFLRLWTYSWNLFQRVKREMTKVSSFSRMSVPAWLQCRLRKILSKAPRWMSLLYWNTQSF